MIACQCNVVTTGDIHKAMDAIWAQDPMRLITPGLVFRYFNRRGKCCRCVPNIVEIVQQYAELCWQRDDLAAYRQRHVRTRQRIRTANAGHTTGNEKQNYASSSFQSGN